MSQKEFEYMLTERLKLFFASAEGKETMSNIDKDLPQENFNIIFDDFAYWIGQTYGI